MAFFIFNNLFKKRKLSAVVSILFILIFIFVTGITPSALRAGIMLSIAMVGMCFYREADSFTSIAFAGLIMCIANPFICYDVGFLLSYTATIGVLFSNIIINRLRKLKFFKSKKLFFILNLAIIPVFATLATMPILMAFNLGISVLGVLFNIFITPFLAIITSLSFGCVILSIFSILAPLAYIASFVNSVVISFMIYVIKIADIIPWSLVYIGGASATVILLAVYVLIWLQLRLKPKYGLATIFVFLFTAILFYNISNYSLVNISPVSTNQNASVVLWTGNSGVLINREKTVKVEQINSFLKQNNIYSLNSIINLHENGEGINEFNIQKIVNVYDDFKYTYSYEPFTDIIITVKKQEKGAAAFLNINGFTAVLNNGQYNFDTADYADVYISGISQGINIKADNIISPGNAPNFLEAKNIKQNAKIVVNKHHLYKIYEGFYGLD